MSARPYHNRYHGDALTGYMPLTLEQRGAYTTLLDLIYDHGGPILDSERLLAGYMQCSVRKWKTIRAQLIEMGKIFITDDGRISNSRAEKELENAAKTSRKHAENGLKGSRKRAENQKKDNENNETNKAGLRRGISHTNTNTNTTTTRNVSPETARARSPDVSEQLAKVCNAAGMVRPPGDMRRLAEWIAAGADVDRDVLPVVERITESLKRRNDRPSTFKLFEPDVLAAVHVRQAEDEEWMRKTAEIEKRYPGPSMDAPIGGYDEPVTEAA